jgi:GNAT superfamily N-acetyltransferase
MKEMTRAFAYMENTSKITNTINSYSDLASLFKSVGLGNRSETETVTTFKISRYIAAIYRENRLLGAGRAFGDEVDCVLICDLAVLPDEQSKGLGGRLLNFLSQNHHSEGYNK